MKHAANVLTKITASGAVQRAAEVVDFDASARTVELSFSSEAEVERWYGIEILSHDADAVDLSRLNDGGAVLDGHDRTKQVGVVERAWIGADLKGRALVRFSRSAAGNEMLQDITDGIRRNVSVGYLVKAVEQTEPRNGVDAFLITRWQPYEISIVPIPADETVGVGRSAERASSQEKFRMPIATRDTNTLHAHIRELIAQADKKQPHRVISRDHEGMPLRTFKQPMSATGAASLRAFLPNLFNAKGELIRTPGAKLAASTAQMDAGIIAASRVAQAGAQVIVYDEPDSAIRVGKRGDVVLHRSPASFRLVEPAAFGIVADDADVLAQALPVSSADISFDNAPNLALTFRFKRADRRNYSDDELAGMIATAITLGLARAADATLLGALSSMPLTTFMISDAAATGLRVRELSCLVGTSGDGAAFEQGTLRAAGIDCEITPDMAGTVIGAFNRCAVSIHSDLPLHAIRTSLDGGLDIVAYANMVALIPDAAYFWKVPAVAP